ncbi:MAG TPA: hypothetical protein VMX38_06850 [Verrucomicrobiae bacterium]|nr:hypothetical protein [Verrucomicrobiae bacterium]
MLVRKGSILYSSWIGLIVLFLAGGSVGARAQQSSVGGGPTTTASLPQHEVLPDSPGTVSSQISLDSESKAITPLSLAQLDPQTQQNQSSQDQQTQSAPPTTTAQKPVGTAAAEAPNASGISASQPAGVAIAPAKQHRVRTLVLRTGAIVAAAVAIGTVVALTEATSSKPPGAH